MLTADFEDRTQSHKEGNTDEHQLQYCDLDTLYSSITLESPKYVKYWAPYSQRRYLELAAKLDSVGATTKSAHFHEYDPDVQEFIWLTFIKSKLVFNYLLTPSGEENCVSTWCATFGPMYPIVPLTINAITSNLLDIKCADDRWVCVLQRTMSSALTNISKRVGQCDSFPEMACYLLCIMFLTSERSATRGDSWRLHLKGAYAILESCDALYSEALKSMDLLDPVTKQAVHVYSFAKNWFVSSETLACLSAPNGGAILDINRSRAQLSYSGFKEGDGYLIGGFNLMKGYSQLLTPIFVEIISYISNFKLIEGVSLSGSEGILHTLPHNAERVALGKRLLDDIKRVEQEHLNFLIIEDFRLRGFMRACNICFCCALRVYILSVFLGKSIYGDEVRHLVQIIEEQLLTTRRIQTFGLCIHWPLFIGALCAPAGAHRENFIHTLKTISDNGTYVARNTVERVERFWKIIDSGELIEEKDYDCITM